MLNYYYGSSHGTTTVHTLCTDADMHDSLPINLKSDIFNIYF